LKIGIVGGTGPEGRGLAVRLSLAGHEPVIGSRDEDRAVQVAGEVVMSVGNPKAAKLISGAANADAARLSEIVFVAVPYSGMEDTLASAGRFLHNKICISVISPIEIVGGTARVVSIPAGSAAEEAERLVPGARWVAGFHTLPARDLMRPATRLDTDCLICSDDADALSTISEITDEIPGLRPVNSGRLENARYLEGMTALLININRIYKAHGSIRIAGI
jgi:NADPH-dependent F420 reductase